MKLRVLILGSGFAGQGHAHAFRDAGVEVVGMVSRTPGGVHFAPIMAALEAGIHIYCDKPLAATASQAKALYQKSVAVGVKTAYAASYRYMPHVLLAKELVSQGAIGEPLEVECISHFNLNPLIPFGWAHQLEQGGGRLNNNFTHKLSVVEHVLEGKLRSVSGSTRNDLAQAPVVDSVHHFRERHNFAPESPDDPDLVWADVDAEWSYTVQAKIETDMALEKPVSALFQHIALQPRFHPDHITFFGSEAAIYIEGHYGHGPLYIHPRDGEWQQVSLPAHIIEAQPAIEDHTQRNWTILAQEFIADVSGEANSGYQTFRDGWIYQEIIDAIRTSDGWTDIASLQV